MRRGAAASKTQTDKETNGQTPGIEYGGLNTQAHSLSTNTVYTFIAAKLQSD